MSLGPTLIKNIESIYPTIKEMIAFIVYSPIIVTTNFLAPP
jgi:hypothetical protein